MNGRRPRGWQAYAHWRRVRFTWFHWCAGRLLTFGRCPRGTWSARHNAYLVREKRIEARKQKQKSREVIAATSQSTYVSDSPWRTKVKIALTFYQLSTAMVNKFSIRFRKIGLSVTVYRWAPRTPRQAFSVRFPLRVVIVLLRLVLSACLYQLRLLSPSRRRSTG